MRLMFVDTAAWVAAEAWWLQVDGSARLRMELIDEARRQRARSLFFRYQDKEFSFTDAGVNERC